MHGRRAVARADTSTHAVGRARARVRTRGARATDGRRDDDVGKVYVGGVLGLEEADLRKEFEPFGKVRRAWVARNPPGFAFLWFEDPLDAEDACRELNNKEVTPTNRLRVELSKPGAGGRNRSRRHCSK